TSCCSASGQLSVSDGARSDLGFMGLLLIHPSIALSHASTAAGLPGRSGPSEQPPWQSLMIHCFAGAGLLGNPAAGAPAQPEGVPLARGAMPSPLDPTNRLRLAAQERKQPQAAAP